MTALAAPAAASAESAVVAAPVPVPGPGGDAAWLQRCACGGTGECAACRRRRLRLQRSATGTVHTGSEPAAAPPIVHRVLRTPGQPLDAATRSSMERSFAHDFSHVRVHADATAAASARAVNAHAYTVGPHVVFGAGRYSPDTPDGRRLLAHELAHTRQQRGRPIPAELGIGAADDAWERAAERSANAALRGDHAGAGESTARAVVQRQPAGPQPLHEDLRSVDAPAHGENARIHIFRRLFECPCRSVPDVRDGVFWNPDAEAFAIAYRHCRGGTTSDVYAEVETNLSAFLGGEAPPQATGRLGFEINVVGREVSGRVQLEVRGGNASDREGIGGRVQVVFQGGQWRVFMTADYLHRLGAAAGDTLSLDLGARIGPVTVEAQVSNALAPSPTGTGALCVDLFDTGTRGCITLGIDDQSGVTPGVQWRGEFGGPSVRQERCFQCLCPPPARRYECMLDIPPEPTSTERDVTVNVPGEFRYFFRLDRATPAEDPELRARSTGSLDEVAAEVSGGGSVTGIAAYASPEAPELHNDGLSRARAETLHGLLRARLPAETTLPEPVAGGELLGRRPAASPGSRLGDIITEHGFRSAEDLSFLLLGEEMPRAELADQFVSLFNALPEPADRLALFGLTPGDPLAPGVLVAVEEFVRRPRAGTRPWERVFRLLRVGVVRTTRPEQQRITESGYTSGSLESLATDRCRQFAEQAERDGVFPDVPDEFRRPRRGRSDRNAECDVEVSEQDRAGGCSWAIPASMRQAPTAPARAPRRFPSLR